MSDQRSLDQEVAWQLVDHAKAKERSTTKPMCTTSSENSSNE